ncbi:unnamed protein product, partial [Mesorhabditis spiculigera]
MDVITSTATAIILNNPHTLWILIVGFVLAFILGAGMGGNDVANAFGTSVGSKVVTIIQAYMLATVFETAGAMLVGSFVVDTMRKGVVDTTLYDQEQQLFMLGQLAILGGCAAWLMIATVMQMPVSTTHSIVGATIGFSIVCKGLEGIRWIEIGKIVSSWFLSPALSGFLSSSLYLIVDHTVLRKPNALESGYIALPIFYAVCVGVNAFMVVYQGSPALHFDKIPWYAAILISVLIGLLTGFAVHFLAIPRIRRKIRDSHSTSSGTRSNSDGELVNESTVEKRVAAWESLEGTKTMPALTMPGRPASEEPRTGLSWLLPRPGQIEETAVLELFKYIQLFTACFAGFAHGANDVSNAIAPLSALWAIWNKGNQEAPVDWWIVLYGVAAICVGLWLLGHRVIKTVGTEMSEINPASGFTIEFGAAMAALIASKLGLPISTTHCLVGSVVCVGYLRSRENVDWRIFRNIAVSWVVTLPVAGLIGAGIMFLLKTVALDKPS